MKKYFQITKYHPKTPGGIERYTDFLTEFLSLHGIYGMTAYSVSRSKEVKENYPFPVFPLKTFGSIFHQPLSLLPVFNSYLRDCDVIIIHLPNPLLLLQVTLYNIFAKKEIIFVHHGDIKNARLISYFNMVMMKRCKNVNICVHLSSKHLETSQELKDISCQHLFIPLEFPLTPLTKKSSKPLVVGFIGRLVKWKGVSTLIRAAAMLQENNFIIAGDGPDFSKLENQISELALQNVTMVGAVDPEHVNERFYTLIDLLVLPSISTRESFGIVVAEAMSRGIPTIVADLDSGVQELAQNGKNSIMFIPDDADSLASKISQLNNSEDYLFYKERGIRTISDHNKKTEKLVLIRHLK